MSTKNGPRNERNRQHTTQRNNNNRRKKETQYLQSIYSGVCLRNDKILYIYVIIIHIPEMDSKKIKDGMARRADKQNIYYIVTK